MIQRHGWALLFHTCIAEQLKKLHTAAEKAKVKDPQGYESNPNVQLFAALSKLIHDVIPKDA